MAKAVCCRMVLAYALLPARAKAADSQTSRQPLSIPPSEYWDGVDGRWSTFHLNVGSPAQIVRLLPGTSATAGDAIWVVLPEGCYAANPDLDQTQCADSRGNLFSRNASTTWYTSRLANEGLYQLDTHEEQRLGLSGNAYYGFETINLVDGLPTFTDHAVAGIATNDFWLGSLGLSPLSINFTSLNEPTPSLLWRLRNTSAIPSTTWAYTAGAAYKEPPVFGSLMFGGYDASRLQESGISMPFWSDQSRDLLVGLQSITYDTLGSTPLMTEGVHTFVDSVVTHMWLPVAVCQAFEQSPTFTFTLGSTSDAASEAGGNVTTIVLPYSAFDLNVTAPYVNDSQPYFPIKRAQNSTQYTLGRVFLQEAYVIADYDRQNFTIGQAAFPQPVTTDLQVILPPDFAMNEHDPGLGTGVIAGIAVGAVVVFVLLLALLVFVRRRALRLRKEHTATEGSRAVAADEKDHLVDDPAYGDRKVALDSQQIYEAQGSTTFQVPGELAVSEAHNRSELLADTLYAGKKPTTNRYELAGEEVAASEMEPTGSRNREPHTTS